MTPIEALQLCADALGNGFLRPEGLTGYHYSCTACGGDLHGDGHAKDCKIGVAVKAAEAALAAEDEIAGSPANLEGLPLRDMRMVVPKPKAHWLDEMLGHPYSDWGHLVSDLLCIKGGAIRYARCTETIKSGGETLHLIEAEVSLSDEDLQQVRVNAEHLLEQGRLRGFTLEVCSEHRQTVHFTIAEPERG